MGPKWTVCISALLLAAAFVYAGCGGEGGITGTGGGNGGEQDTLAPSVNMTSPVDGSNLPSILSITGTATDDTEIDTVFFEIRDLCGNVVEDFEDISSPYGTEWDSSGEPDGGYRVCMSAVDTAGNYSDWVCAGVSRGTSPVVFSGFSPLAAYRGRSIRAVGSGFGSTSGIVIVSGREATVEEWTDTEVTFVIPMLVPEDALVGMELIVECRWRVTGSIDITPPGMIRITDDHAEEHDPCWSPDGSMIYFASVRSGNWDIWRISADGGEAEQVTFDSASDFTPDINPSSGELAWMSDRTFSGMNPDGDYDIFKGFIPCGGGACTITLVTTDNDLNRAPAWSPQVYMGYSLCYGQFYDPEDDGSTIPTIYLKSNTTTDVLDEGMEGNFSGNGQNVVYQDNNYQIRKKHVGGGDPVILTSGHSDFRPHWGWVNDKIVFSRYSDNGYEGIFMMEADGSNVEPVADHRYVETEPSWSPDCTRIVFIAHRWSNFDVYVYEVP